MTEMKNEQMTGTPVETPTDVDQSVVVEKKGRRPLRTVLLLIVPLLLLGGGLYYYLTSGGSVSTDNAAVKQDIVSVSPQVNGPIVEVDVKNGDRVTAGQVLYRIDPAPYQVALEQAQAQLSAAQLATTLLRTQAAGTGADITGSQASLDIAQRALARQNQLLAQGFTTKVNYDNALDDVRKAETALADAKARAANASSAIAPGQQPSVAQAQAAIDKAKLDLTRTTIRAPMAGQIANADRLQLGQMAVQGIGMLSLVRSNAAWIEANFKEKDLSRMVPGQRATIKIDAYPGHKWPGFVQSVGAGTGAEFAILPAQNANGNWVKVEQRVPVRVFFDGTPDRPMIAGLSADVTVDLNSKK